MDLKPTIIIPPFKKFCMTIGNLPSSYVESMTYLEMIMWLCNYLENTVIPTVNNNGKAVTELQNLFVQLQNFVNDYQTALSKDFSDLKNWTENYLENLDVQQEINNKLDEMVESGALDEIFAHWIHKLNWFYITPQTTQAELQADLDTLGTKVVEFQKGEYNFDNTLHLNANTTLILNESTLNFSVNHGFFNFYGTDTPTLYNGNGNIKILNGTIKGGAISICHANNVLLQNINFIDILNDHVLEIASCQNYVVDNCYFEGVAKQIDSRNYVECIQIDNMNAGNFPWFSNSTPYDETENHNITIKNCTFENPNISEITKENIRLYTCIGSHTNTNQVFHRNIKIENCIFNSPEHRAIRMLSYINVNINYCEFINNLNVKKRVISCENYNRNIIIKNSKFINNMSFQTDAHIKDFTFENNYLENQSPIFVDDVAEVTATNEAFFILNRINGIFNFKNNFIYNSILYFIRLNSNVENYADKTFVNIENNTFINDNCIGFLHLYAQTNYNVSNNNFITNGKSTNVTGAQNSIIRFSGKALKTIIKDNCFPNNDILNQFVGGPIDFQFSNSSNYDFSNIYDCQTSAFNTNNATSFNSLSLTNGKKISDFKYILIVIGSLSDSLQTIVLRPITANRKLTSHNYSLSTYIGTELVTGNLSIDVENNTMSGSLSNYRFKNIYLFN